MDLSLKSKVVCVVACFSVTLITAYLSQQCTLLLMANPILVASMGASTVILLTNPKSPMATPWALLASHLLSASIGLFCVLCIPNFVLASAMAVSGSISAMFLFRCLHPPGAATAIAPVIVGQPIISIGYSFVFMPVGLNAVTILVLVWLIKRSMLWLE